jgi:serine/threonine protein phosphatase PrpC
MTTIRTKPFDIRGVKLSAEEGFVLSRVSDSLSLHELVDVSGLPEDRVVEVLRRLVAEGTLEVDPPLGGHLEVEPMELQPMELEPVELEPLELEPLELEPMGPELVPLAGHTVAVCGLSDVGIARSNNEDAFRIVDLTTAASVDTSEQTDVDLGPRGMLLVVCDGMGGENAGEVASALAVEVISSHLVTSREPDAATALRAAVDHANELVVAASDEPGKKGMGTTVVALLIRDDEVYTAEVGDSRAYVLRGGNLVQLSKDQTYVQLLLDQGLMTPETIKSSVAKNVVLQALGKAPELIVAQRRLALRAGDRLLVCSDGLSSYVTDDEIRAVLDSNVSLHDGCARLVAMANVRGGHDNVTVVTALVGEQLPPPGANESVPDTLSTLRAYAVGEDAG